MRVLKILLAPIVLGLAVIAFARLGVADQPVNEEDCADYAVRIQEDNGWTVGQRSKPAKFYCDAKYSYNLIAADRGVLLCVCNRTADSSD